VAVQIWNTKAWLLNSQEISSCNHT